MRTSLFPLLGLPLVPVVYGAPSNVSTDRFLQSIGVNENAVPASAKSRGGIEFTCAVLSVLGGNTTHFVTSSEGALYTAEAHAHW